jgi:FtsP/CotA-like multicopper oxidase with cupredoxin domain
VARAHSDRATVDDPECSEGLGAAKDDVVFRITSLISFPAMHRVSRRKLLVGGGAAAGGLPLLHSLVPHAGVHATLAGDPATAGAAQHGKSGHGGGAAGPTFRDGATVDHRANGFNPTDMLRDFDWGRTRRLASGRTLREWELSASDKEIEVAPGVKFPAWVYNGRVPGPTLRCREGERLRIRFVNGSAHPHTIHFHGIHPAEMDGVPEIGLGMIQPGSSATYEFDAEPFGLDRKSVV